MPSATVGPGAAIEPPLAATLLTVSNGLAVSNDHSIDPSLSETANSLPLAPPAMTTPGQAETAAELFVRALLALSSGENQARSPSFRRRAATPPLVRP